MKSLNSDIGTKRPVARFAKGDLLGICHLLSIQQVCSAFPASWAMVGHMQVLAIPSSTVVHNI